VLNYKDRRGLHFVQFDFLTGCPGIQLSIWMGLGVFKLSVFSLKFIFPFFHHRLQQVSIRHARYFKGKHGKLYIVEKVNRRRFREKI